MPEGTNVETGPERGLCNAATKVATSHLVLNDGAHRVLRHSSVPRWGADML